MKRRRRSHRRRSGKRILGALLALAVILAAGPLRQRIADLIDPPAWIIVLDGGHGGYDPGSIAADGTMEKDVALQIALRAGAILEREDDLRVVYTRDSDAVSWPAREADDLAARVRIAQAARADMLVSIHLNAAENTDASGYETYIRADSERMFDIAQRIHAEFAR